MLISLKVFPVVPKERKMVRIYTFELRLSHDKHKGNQAHIFVQEAQSNKLTHLKFLVIAAISRSPLYAVSHSLRLAGRQSGITKKRKEFLLPFRNRKTLSELIAQ